MKIKVSLFFTVTVFFLSFILSAGIKEELAEIGKLYNSGNYKEAALLSEKTLKNMVKDPEEPLAGKIYQLGHDSHTRLGKYEEQSLLLDFVMKHFPENLSILEKLNKGFSHGYILDGKLVRGYPRGVRAKNVNLQEYDRIRLLQHLYKAKKKFDDADPVIRGKYYAALARFLMRECGETWKYQFLTDLKTAPEYDKNSSYSYSPPPVDEKGEPLLYKEPSSFESAVNDGERLRYCWKMMKKAPQNSAIYKQALRDFANFLYREFDFLFLDEQLKNEYYNYEENIEKLRSLKENESICRLASGVKKITLPEEYNYIRLLREAGENTLPARIFTSRLQLDKAVEYYRKALKKSPGNKNILDEIKNITGNHGMILPVKMGVEGKNAEVKLIYRNAESALVTVRELDWKKLYDTFLTKRSLVNEKVPYDLYSFMGYSYWYNNKNHILRQESPWKELAEGKIIDSFEMKLNPRKGYLNTGTKIPLAGIKKAGFYLVTVKLKGGTVCETLYCVTKGTLLSINGKAGTRIIFCDAETGEALAGKKLFLHTYRNICAGNPEEVKAFGSRNKILAERKEFVTGKDGSFIIPRENKSQTSFLVSFDRKYPLFMRMNIVNGNWHFSGFSERRRVFFITDRPIYKPGDTVHFTGYVRTPSYTEGKTVEIPEKYSVSIRGARNMKLYSKSLPVDEKTSSFTSSVKLPEDAPLGTYSIYGKNGRITFRVEEFKKNDYELKISSGASSVKNGEKVQFFLHGKYYTGAPMNGAKISYKVYRKEKFFSFPLSAPFDFLYGKGYFFCSKRLMAPVDSVHWGNTGEELVMDGELKADKEGKGVVTIPEKITKRFAGRDSLYTIKAEIKDDSNSLAAAAYSVTVSNTPFHVYILCGKGFYKPGENITPEVAVYSPEGEKIQEGFVVYSLYTRTMGKDQLPVKGKLVKREKFSLKEEKFTVSIKKSSSYLLEAEVITPKGKVTASQIIFVRGMEMKEKEVSGEIFTELPLEIIRDKSSYAPGEKVKILITSKWENGTFFLFRHPERESSMEKAVMTGKSMVVEMAITDKDYPNTFFEVVTVRDGKVHSEKMNIPVPPEKKIMDITLLPAEKTVSPGGKLPLKVQLKDRKGNPVQGVFTLAVYDRKLEQITKNNVADIFSFFWGWKREFFSSIEHLMQSDIPVHKGSFIPNLSSIWTLWFLPEKTSYGFRKEKNNETANGDMGISRPVNRRVRLMKGRSSAPAVAMAMAPLSLRANTDALLSGTASGSMEDMENTVSIRENFADSLLWIGKKEVGKDGTAEILIPVSDDLTSWRVRVWGLTFDNSVGEARTGFTVNRELMCRLTLPRFLVDGDESTVVAHFHNLKDKEMDITFTLQNNTPSAVITGGTKSGKMILPGNGYKSISFPVKAMREGEGSFTLKAWDAASRKSDALLLKLPVLVKGSPQTHYYGGVLDKNMNTKNISFTVPEKRRKNTLIFTVGLAPSVAAPAMRLLPFLAAEKSKNVFGIVSRFVPALAAKKVLDTLDLTFKDLAFAKTSSDPLWNGYLWKNDMPVYTETLFSGNLAEGEKMLLAMQNSDGGWGWFSGNHERSYPDTTAEVIEALLYVKAYKKEKTPAAFEKGVKFLEDYIEKRLAVIRKNNAVPSDTDALVLNVLTQCGRQVPEMEKKLLEKKTVLSPWGLAMLGKALGKNSPQRKEVIRNLYQYLTENRENGTAYLSIPVSFCCFWYGNENMTNSAFLSLLLEEDAANPLCTALARYLAINIQYSPWRNSTRSLGKVLQALSEYMLKNKETDVDMKITLSLNGKEWKKVKIDRKNMWKELSFSIEENSPEGKKFLQNGKQNLTVSYTGKGHLLYNFALSYFSLEEKIIPAGREMKIKRKYYKKIPVKTSSFMVDGKGSSVKVQEENFVRKELLEGEIIRAGDIVEVELITESGNDYDYVCLKDPLPAGFEYVDPVSGYKWFSGPVYHEYGKTEAKFYLRNLARGKGNISYELRALLPGIYTALPARGKGEYAPLLKCNTESLQCIIR